MEENLKISCVGETLTAALTGEIDHHRAVSVRADIDEAMYRELPKTLVIDIGGVDFMDSSGIGVLIGRKKTMDMHRGEICARNLGERAQKIFDKSGLAQIILVESGREEKQ